MAFVSSAVLNIHAPRTASSLTSTCRAIGHSSFSRRQHARLVDQKRVGATMPENTTSMTMITPEMGRIGIAVYGVLMAGGGIGAFLKSGSKPSIISGVSSAVVLGVMYAQNNVQGALITAAVLSVVFLARLVKTKKFIPAGLLFTLSVLATIFFYVAK